MLVDKIKFSNENVSPNEQILTHVTEIINAYVLRVMQLETQGFMRKINFTCTKLLQKDNVLAKLLNASGQNNIVGLKNKLNQ